MFPVICTRYMQNATFFLLSFFLNSTRLHELERLTSRFAAAAL